MPEQFCYCGAKMIEIQPCKYRCPNEGFILDCEDAQGLPK